MKPMILPLLLIFASSAHAIVDMKNANYSNTWVDLELPGSGYELKVSRTYNSRSLMNGIFGFGWCSDYETKLDVTAEGNLKLTECGAGQELNYFPREFNKKDIDKTISAITDALKAQRKFDDKTIKNMAKDMITNHELRAQYAYEYKVAVPVKEGTQFFANGREVDSIVFQKGLYLRSVTDGSSQRFTNKGKLAQIYDKNGNYLKFEYDGDSIKEVVDSNGRKLSFKYYSNKKVKTISAPGNLVAEYKFANLDDLSSVKNAWNNTYNYEYDSLHNLTKATFPDNTFIKLTYDTKKDWVTSYADRDKCLEEYGYEFSEREPKNHYWATVKKTCGKEIVNESKHEFWYKERADGQVFLQKVGSTINGNVVEVVYHETFGKPVSIRRGPESFSFEYYPNGQVKNKNGQFLKLSYDYDKGSKKVETVTATSLNEKGKVVGTRKSSFKYDNKGNLTFAANSEGQKVQMTYDARGRIATITDQAKKFVKIQYDEKSGRPAIVSRPGLGTIKVSYKAGGEIDKVDSKEGPTIAMQVASTFNNLLEIISPATAEIYN